MAEHGQLYLKQRPRLCHPEVIQLEMKSFRRTGLQARPGNESLDGCGAPSYQRANSVFHFDACLTGMNFQ